MKRARLKLSLNIHVNDYFTSCGSLSADQADIGLLKKIKLMKKDIILAGVGGQGILSIAAVIDWAAINLGINVKQAEVHGMSQRGGAVQSHLRLSSNTIYSDLIPAKSADIILSVEPLEALRYGSFLVKDGWIISSSNTYKNIVDYPDSNYLEKQYSNWPFKIIIDAEKLAKVAGSVKTTNMVMLGAAATKIEVSIDALEDGIKAVFGTKGHKVVDMNLEAFSLGMQQSN